MKNTYEINYNKLTICKQSYKLLDCRYNLIKIELSSEHFINMNDKSKIYYNDLINENKCKSYHIRIISDNSHVDLEIFKIKARGTQLRIFYDGNKYPMYSKCKKMFNCGKLIVKPLNKDCDECEAMAKLFETTTALSNDCEEMAKLFETTTAPSNNCEEMAELFVTTLEPTNNSDMLDQLCNTTSNPLSLTSIIESPAITTITNKVNKGEKMLAMESMVGFEIGDIIRIVDILNPNNYENTIISDIDSLIILIERPLQRCYNMNSIIINMTKLINIPELFTTIS